MTKALEKEMGEMDEVVVGFFWVLGIEGLF